MSGFGLVRRVALGFGLRVRSGCGRCGPAAWWCISSSEEGHGLAAGPGDYEADGDGRGPDRPCGERVVPQEDARDQGQDEADRAEYLGQPPVRAGGVPLFEEFVQDLSDPVVDRVAEAGQELFLGPHGEGLSAGPGWAGCWWQLPALMPGVS